MDNQIKLVTHAKIRFLNNGIVQCLPIEDILEFKNNRPSTTKDFNPKQIYTTLRKRDDDDEDGEEIVVGVQIDGLACGIDELNVLLKRRNHFSPLDLSTIQEYRDNYESDKTKKAQEKNDNVKKCKQLDVKKSKENVKSKEIAAKAAAAEQNRQQQIFDEKIKNFIRSGDLQLQISANNESESNKKSEGTLKDVATVSDASDTVQHAFPTNDNFKNFNNDTAKSTGHGVQDKDIVNDSNTNEKHENAAYTTPSFIDVDQVTSRETEIPNEKNGNNIISSNDSIIQEAASSATSPIDALADNNPFNSIFFEVDVQNIANVVPPSTYNEQNEKFEKMNQIIQELQYKYQVMTAKFESLETTNKQLRKQLTIYQNADPVIAGSSKSSDVGYVTENENNGLSAASTPKQKNSDVSDTELSAENYSVVSKKYKKRLFHAPEESEGTDSKKSKLQGEDNGNGFKDKTIKIVNGKKVEMICLGNGVYIKSSDWEKAFQKRSVSLFAKEIVRILYTPDELSKRSVSGDPACLTPNGKHSRKPMSPTNHIAIKRTIIYYIRKKTTLKKGSKEYEKEVNKINHFITEVINDTIKKIRKEKGIILPGKRRKIPKDQDNADENDQLENDINSDEGDK